jgi:hypothetical protein
MLSLVGVNVESTADWRREKPKRPDGEVAQLLGENGRGPFAPEESKLRRKIARE